MNLSNTELLVIIILIIAIIALILWFFHFNGKEEHQKKAHDKTCKDKPAACPTPCPVPCSPPATPQLDYTSGTPQLNFFWPAVANADRYDVYILGPTNTTFLGTTQISFLMPMPPGSYTVIVIAKSGNCSSEAAISLPILVIQAGCRSDSDCSPGQCCKNGACNICGFCTTDRDCTLPEICVSSNCKTESCTSIEGCVGLGPGYTCLGGFCVPFP